MYSNIKIQTFYKQILNIKDSVWFLAASSQFAWGGEVIKRKRNISERYIVLSRYWCIILLVPVSSCHKAMTWCDRKGTFSSQTLFPGRIKVVPRAISASWGALCKLFFSVLGEWSVMSWDQHFYCSKLKSAFNGLLETKEKTSCTLGEEDGLAVSGVTVVSKVVDYTPAL